VRLDPTLASRVTYRHTSVEDLAATGAFFDCVIASEVLEHVADLDAFLAASAAVVRPGGALVATTINRTAPAFALAILAAEYVLRIVPAGTHEWAKFVTPEELAAALAQCGMAQEAVQGFAYSPLAKEWSRTDSTLINYGLVARKAA
jgi:2-polyprenyl-6-hydroxyphenyl methylase/3-demethylubiquinone-9 3-methyltransferase